MDVHKAFAILQDDSQFKEWKQQHPKTYLVTFFTEINEQLQLGNWRAGFYDKTSDKVATFTIGPQIMFEPFSEAFKKPGALPELHLNTVTITAQDALDAGLKVQREKYTQHLALKGFLLLQDGVWNVTFLTRTFCAINVRVDVSDGKIHEHKVLSFFDLKQKNM